jgi:class 3 adenylate cyclase/tetratricopeptide (TPR) repeat protein
MQLLIGAGPNSTTNDAADPCGHCGFPLQASARFCGGCGRPRATATPLAAHALSFLQSNVSADMADRILRSGTAMLGERKHVTVLFADIRGSTALIDQLDPEEALEALGPILKRLMDAVHTHDGLVNQTRGDGIMALFGAPIASEDHAVQACRAALAIREAIDAFNRSHGRRIEIRIGINSGQVVIHSIGSNLTMNYDAVGRTVHLAARMETLAAPDTIKLTADTFQLAQGFISARPLGLESAKGVADPVETYELLAMRPRTRWQARSSGGLSTLAGRHNELARLSDALDAAAAARGHALTIVGGAGIGKSRLAHEFVTHLSDEWLVLQTACTPQHTNSSYYPVSTLMRAIFGVSAGDTSASAASRARAQVARLSPDLLVHLPAIFSLLDLSSDDAGWKNLEPPERRRKINEAITALIFHQERLTPLVILIEDVHWIDAETRLVLDNFVRAIGNVRILVVATQRPERLWSSAKVERLDLAPLDEAEGDRLLDALLGDDSSLGPIRRRILTQAQGNPLFVEELAMALKETNVLVGDAGKYKVSNAATGIEIPETIHSVLASRIDLLDRPTKSLLQMAAVIGKDISIAVLSGMAGVDSDELEARLQVLEAGDFLWSIRTSNMVEYSFKHELTREVAYGMLLLSVRRYLHAKATETIELRFSDRLDEHIDRLADHAFLAELWQKAVPYQLRSCRRAIKRGANQDAIAIYERGLETLSHWPDSRKKTISEIDLHLAVVTALEPLGMHRRIAEVLRESRRLAETSGEPWRIAAVNCQLAVGLWRLGHHAEAMTAAQDAQSIAEQVGEPVLTFAALHQVGIIHHEVGAFARSLEFHEKCLAMETPQIDERRAGWAALPSVMLRTFMTDSLIDLGDFDRAERLAEEASGLAKSANHAYSRANINHVFARLRTAQGRPAEALSLLQESWQTCLDLEMKQMYPIFASRMGEAHLALGEVEAALQILAVPEQLDMPLAEHSFGWRFLFVAQGHALLAAGRHAEAKASAERALALAEQRGEPPQIANAKKLLGDVARNGDTADMAQAERYYREAFTLAEQCAMRPMMAQCREALAALVD